MKSHAQRLGYRIALSLLIVAFFSSTGIEPTSASLASTPPFSGWLVLDGDDDYAEAEDHPELDVGDEAGESLTIEAWVNFQRFSCAHIIYKPDAYWLYGNYDPITKASCIGFMLWSAPGQPWGFEHCHRPKYSYGWHHVAGVFRKEAAEMMLYLDGEAIGGPYYFPTINNSSESLKVGRGWTAGVLTGGVDEVRISDVARYTGSTYAVPTSAFSCDEHTNALWHFDEFEGATIFHDACGAADNLLTGYNGAHTEGVPVHRVFLPLTVKQ